MTPRDALRTLVSTIPEEVQGDGTYRASERLLAYIDHFGDDGQDDAGYWACEDDDAPVSAPLPASASPAVTQVRDAEIRVYDQAPETDDASDMYVMHVLGVSVLVRLVREEDDSESGPYPVRPKIVIAASGQFIVGVNDIENTYGDSPRS